MASKPKRSSRRSHQPSPSIWQRWKWWFIGGGAIAGVIVLVVLSNALSGIETTGGEVEVTTSSGQAVAASGQPMPDFPVIYYQDYPGQEVLGSPEPRLHSLLTGKPVVMNYWASLCAPCRAEMPGFEKVWKKYQDRVLFMGLDVGRLVPGYGDQEQSQKELGELGITYAAGSPENIQGAYDLEVQGFPSTDFFTADGEIHRKWVGTLSESDLTDMVEDLLKASAAVRPQIGEAVPTLPAAHSPPYTYNSRPPTSGNHLDRPGAYGLSTTPLVPEAVVHNLEHGAVAIWYQPGDSALADRVRSLVSELGSQCLVAGPYADMEYRVAATAWGRLLGLDAFDAESLRAFVAAYKGQGPEAGICLKES